VVTRVNGEERQRGSAREMAFDIPTLLAYISGVMTLEPGDVVATGTPAGVGPLAAGDVVEVEVVGYSTVRNPVVAGRARSAPEPAVSPGVAPRMLSISRGTGNPDGRRAGGRGARGWFAVSVGVNVVVLGLFLRALTLHERWYEQFTRRSGAVPAERISFLRLPPGQTSQAGRSGGDGRPPSAARPGTADASLRPHRRPRSCRRRAPRHPSRPRGRPSGRPRAGAVAARSSGTAGRRPACARPTPTRDCGGGRRGGERAQVGQGAGGQRDRRPVRPGARLDRRGAGDRGRPAQAGRLDGEGCRRHVGHGPAEHPPGQDQGADGAPRLLTTNLQKNLRSNPNELANDRRLAQARQEIMDHAASGMAEDDFRGAVRAIRARKDRERNARLAERRRAAESSTAEDAGAQP
jgi:hypothetical protein